MTAGEIASAILAYLTAQSYTVWRGARATQRYTVELAF